MLDTAVRVLRCCRYFDFMVHLGTSPQGLEAFETFALGESFFGQVLG